MFNSPTSLAALTFDRPADGSKLIDKVELNKINHGE